MLKKTLKTFIYAASLAGMALLPAQASVTQMCGEGRVIDLYSGGWGGGEIFIKIDESEQSAQTYFAAPMGVVRVSPTIDDNHKNRIYSTLLLAVAKDQIVELRSHTQNSSGIANCSFVSQVTIRATS